MAKGVFVFERRSTMGFFFLVLLHVWTLLSLAGRIKTETEELLPAENEEKTVLMSRFLTDMIIHLACLTSLSKHLSFVRRVLFLHFASAQGTVCPFPCSHLLVKEGGKKTPEICREFFERFFVNWVQSHICFSVNIKLGRRVEVSFKPLSVVVAWLTWRLLTIRINNGILTMFFSWWEECISVWAFFFFSVREILS